MDFNRNLTLDLNWLRFDKKELILENLSFLMEEKSKSNSFSTFGAFFKYI